MTYESTWKSASAFSAVKCSLCFSSSLGFNEDASQGSRFKTNTGSSTRNSYTTQIFAKWTRDDEEKAPCCLSAGNRDLHKILWTLEPGHGVSGVTFL